MAGVSTKEIRTRIRSMENTRQITKAMEMVAASKLRKTQAQVQNSRPYFEIIYRVMCDIARSNHESDLPFLNPVGKTGKLAYLVIAGDRGLAGGYNSNILKACQAALKDRDCTILPVGKRALDFFEARSYSIITDVYADAEHVTIGDCFSIARMLCAGFLSGEYAEVAVGYTRFVSVLSQRPITLSLLPLTFAEEESSSTNSEFLYEPSSPEVFRTITPEYLGGVLYGALCESRASEQAARRTAMDTATQNADDMIADLSLKYNQARQAAITQEITEIVAGS